MATSSPRARVFLDTNVLISAFFSPSGTPAQILGLHAARDIEIVISQQVLDELRSAATRKILGRLPMILAYFLSSPPEIVPNPQTTEVGRMVADVNIDDAPILAAALTSDVDYFVTGDRTFLREARAAQTSLTVLTPRELIDQLERSR